MSKSFTLTPAQVTEKTRLASLAYDLQSELSDLLAPLADGETRPASWWSTVTLLADRFNDTLDAMDSLASTVAQDWQADWDDRSDQWQESDQGQEISQMIDAWAQFESQPFEIPITEPEGTDIEPPDDQSIVEFEDLPATAG